MNSVEQVNTDTVSSVQFDENVPSTSIVQSNIDNSISGIVNQNFTKEYMREKTNEFIEKRFTIHKYKDWVTYNDIEYVNEDLISSVPFMIWKTLRWVSMFMISPFCANPILGCILYAFLIISIFLVVDYYYKTKCIMKQTGQALNNKYLKAKLEPHIKQINESYKQKNAEKRIMIKTKAIKELGTETYNFKIATEGDSLLTLK
jgi:hypothetical protein